MDEVSFKNFGKNEILARQLVSSEKMTRWNVKEGASLDKLRSVAQNLFNNCPLSIKDKVNLYKHLEEAVRNKEYYYKHTFKGKIVDYLRHIPFIANLFDKPIKNTNLLMHAIFKNPEVQAAYVNSLNIDANQLRKNEIIKGAKELAEKGVESCCGLRIYNYLITRVFSSLGVNLIYKFPDVPSNFFFGKNGGKHNDVLIMGIATETWDLQKIRNSAKESCEFIHKVQAERIAKGENPYTKVFFPFVVPGEIDHAILVAFELNPQDPKAAKISVVNPLGANTNYKKCEAHFALGCREAFSSKDTTIVFNQIKQQLDGLTCGFHQVLNMKELIDQSDIQKYVSEGKLSVRSTESIREWISRINPEKDLKILQS